MKILVAEDDKLTALALQTVLQKEGYVTFFSFDGKDALEKIRQHKPDLIITDIMLPKVNGLDIIKFVKETPEHRETPVIVISILEKEETIFKALELGAADFIPKPFSAVDLSLRIKKYITNP
jgi:DNA-binding response OmpR family regulator